MIAQCLMGCSIIVLYLLVVPWVGGDICLNLTAEEQQRALLG